MVARAPRHGPPFTRNDEQEIQRGSMNGMSQSAKPEARIDPWLGGECGARCHRFTARRTRCPRADRPFLLGSDTGRLAVVDALRRAVGALPFPPGP